MRRSFCTFRQLPVKRRLGPSVNPYSGSWLTFRLTNQTPGRRRPTIGVPKLLQIHALVCEPDQQPEVPALARKEGSAKAAHQRVFTGPDVRQGAAQPSDTLRRLFLILKRKQHQKLVAAQPKRLPADRRLRFQNLCHALQRPVPRHMPVPVADSFQVIEVYKIRALSSTRPDIT
ncbi:hypothetical protein ACVWZX_001926 [Deinococcus sp. UYEF24]